MTAMGHENPYDPTTPLPSRHLNAVGDYVPPNTPALEPLEMPFSQRHAEEKTNFEGKDIVESIAKITSSEIPLSDAVYHMGEMVRIIIEAEVINVGFDHSPHDPKAIRRVHKFKAKDGVAVDWDFDVERFRR